MLAVFADLLTLTRSALKAQQSRLRELTLNLLYDDDALLKQVQFPYSSYSIHFRLSGTLLCPPRLTFSLALLRP